MGRYLIFSQGNLINHQMFEQIKAVASQDRNAAFSIIEGTSLPITEIWKDENVQAIARRQAVESLAKLERIRTIPAMPYNTPKVLAK